jgi:hypothetical protein
MPRFDGTGPKGSGPMTGRRRGCCVLKIPNTPEEPVTGFAGESGWPVRFFLDETFTPMATITAIRMR